MAVTNDDRPGFSKLNLTTRSTQVREQLEQAIQRGDYPAGSQLPSERELTQMFGVSRVSVREALRSLEALGFVQVKHGAKTTVLDPSRRASHDLRRWMTANRGEVLELLTVRGALDALAGKEAAARQDRDAIATVRDAHEAFAAAVTDGARDRFVDLDCAFHIAVADAAGIVLLRDLLVELHHQLTESRALFFDPGDRAATSADEHATIVEAIERGDVDAARLATATHIASVRRVMEDF